MKNIKLYAISMALPLILTSCGGGGGGSGGTTTSKSPNPQEYNGSIRNIPLPTLSPDVPKSTSIDSSQRTKTMRVDFVDTYGEDGESFSYVRTASLIASSDLSTTEIDVQTVHINWRSNETRSYGQWYLGVFDPDFEMRYKILADGNWYLAPIGDTIKSLPTGSYKYGSQPISKEVSDILLFAFNSQSFEPPRSANNFNLIRVRTVGPPQFNQDMYGPGQQQGFESGPIEINANFDNLTGAIKGSTYSRVTQNGTAITGDIAINSKDGSFTGSGSLTGLPDTISPSSVSIFGNFHGNLAEGVSGIYHTDDESENVAIGAFMAARCASWDNC